MEPHMPHMHLRSFLIYQTAEGWFWNWPHLKRAVGPFPTLPSAIANLQSVMGLEAMRHDPRTGPCPTCGFQIKEMGQAKPMVIEED